MVRPPQIGSTLLLALAGLGGLSAWGLAQAPGPARLVAPPDLLWREPLTDSGVAGAPEAFRTVRQCLVPRDRSFPLGGAQTVVLRAAAATEAEVVVGINPNLVRVVGIAEGNEQGYAPADPNSERVASPARLNFVAARFGPTLVVSSAGEQRFIHHEYRLVRLRVIAPPGVSVTRQATPPIDGAPPGTHLEAP